MRIVNIITATGFGGAENVLGDLLERLPPHYESSVISLTTIGDVGERLQARGIPVTALGMTRKSLGVQALFQLRKMLKEAQPDIVQTWMYHPDLLGGLAARLAGVPSLVWWIHHNKLSIEHNGLRTVMISRACAALSHYLPDRILCCANTALEEHVRIGYAASKMEVLPNGFDMSRFRPAPEMRAKVRSEIGVAPDAPLLAMIGRFDIQKGHRVLVDAAALLRKKRPDVHYLLAGADVDIGNTALASWLDEHGLRDSFTLLGERDDIPRLLAAVDALVLPSLSEAFPLVVGEAMAVGVPCIASDVGDTRFLIGDTGLVVPPGDPEVLANAIDEFLSRPESDRQSCGVRARQRVLDNFEISRIIARYEDLCERLLDGGKAAPKALCGDIRD
jgi:glycosyltransferase involved in cell wall biosynthesis